MNNERIEKVLALAMVANPDLPLPLSLTNIDLDDITATPNSKRNTRATMYARDTGEIVRYVGSADVVYDRIDIAAYWQDAVLIEDRDAVQVKDLVALLRTRYGLDVLDSEVVNAEDLLPDQGEVTITIDNALSPLYTGQVTLAFTKDAGLTQQDGVAYVLGALDVSDNPVLAYSDDPLTLECSVNHGVWQSMVRGRDSLTGQYHYQLNGNLNQADIRIRGGRVSLIDNDGSYVPITRLVTYRGSPDATGYCAGIPTLVSVAPDVFAYRTDLLHADYFFDGCVALTTVPDHLFSACSKLLTAKAVLRNTGLTTLSATLFESCSNLITLESAFEQCDKLTTIPVGLFATNTALQSLRRTFMGCVALDANPATATLLAGLTKLTDVGYLFAGCPAVTAIPSGFFKSQSVLVKADGVFQNCTALASIPTDLFIHTPLLNTVSYLFHNCQAIQAIPDGIFQYQPNLEYAEYTFYGTGILTTPTVMFSFTRRLISIDYIFGQCGSLKTIPAELLTPLLRLQSANGVWYGCTGITILPDTLLFGNTNLLTAQWIFANTRITQIPERLFLNNTKLTDVRGAFAYTPLNTAPPASLFSTLTRLTSAALLFFKCAALKAVPGSLFASNPQLQNLHGTFAYSGLAMNVAAIFTNMGSVVQVSDIGGLYQGCVNMTGSFSADLRTTLTNSAVNWQDGDSVQGCVAGNSKLTDYANVGSLYKTPLTALV